MSEGKVSADQCVKLDLRGFHRRLPRATISWHVGQLADGDVLALILDIDANTRSAIKAIRCCGAEIVTEEELGDRRLLKVRRSSILPAAQELDMRGRRCPMPVIEARRKLQAMPSGEVLKLLTDCTSAPAEVSAWAANSSDVAFIDSWRQGSDHFYLLGSH